MRAALPAALLSLASVGALAQQPVLSSIRVTADARVSAQPDRAQIDIGINSRAPHSQEAAEQNARAVQAMLDAVRQAVPAAQLKTISYSLNPNYDYHPGSEPTINGYLAANVVQATVDDLARIGPVIDAATRAGANHVNGIHFTLRDEEAVRTEALRQAALKARAQADALAQALGLKLVRVLTVEEDSPRITPLFHPVARAAGVSSQVATPVEAGTLEIAADVTLTVEVSPAAR
jgi:uncharacterized protein